MIVANDTIPTSKYIWHDVSRTVRMIKNQVGSLVSAV